MLGDKVEMTGKALRVRSFGRRGIIAVAASIAFGRTAAFGQPLEPEGLAPEPSFPLDRGLTVQDQLWLLADDRRKVRLENRHTGEVFEAAHSGLGDFEPAAMDRFNRFMRDWREDAVISMDRDLLALLHTIHQAVDRRPLHILSGYRTVRTNAMLAEINEGVAPNSLHMRGQAADFFVPGYDLEDLRDLALELQVGGVGFYPQSGFLHVDAGPVRSWTG